MGQPKGDGKGGGKTKGKNKAKAKAKSKTKPPAKGVKVWAKDVNAKDIKSACMSGGKCFRFQKNACSDKNCPWDHSCAICGSTDCYGDSHRQ